MRLIVTALRPEAEPLIQALNLKRDLELSSIEVYRNKNYALVITGTGKIRSAVGTTLLISRYGKKNSVVCNIGIAGASKLYEKGELCLINKLIDDSTREAFYPELQVDLKLKQALLETVDLPFKEIASSQAPRNDTSMRADDLVDMEGAGFFRAALTLLPLEQITLLKVVSDHFNPETITKDYIAELITAQTDKILQYIDSYSNHIQKNLRAPLEDDEENLLTAFAQELSLTNTQKLQLLSKAKESVVTNKKERNKLFERILDALP